MRFANALGLRLDGADAIEAKLDGAIVWTPGGGPTPVQYAAARFQGDAAYLRAALTLGGVGAINFEIQALVRVTGARTSEDRVFMAQFAAGRQAGIFCSNVSPNNVHTGDSQVGSVGGFIGANPVVGDWHLMTFSADGTTGATGLWRGSIESLDRTTVPFVAGGRTKGVEASLQANRVDLNGGGVDNGWLNGIEYAHLRAYAAQRSDAQRQADLLNVDPTGALFWLDFVDNGSGGLAVIDRTGNGMVPTIAGGTLVVGPEF